METREIRNHLDEVIGQISLPDGTSEAHWASVLAPYRVAPPTPDEVAMKEAMIDWSMKSEFARKVVASLQIWVDAYDLSSEQRLWLHSRLRAVPVSLANSGQGIIDMLNLVVSGEAKGALAAVEQMIPDDFSEPYHALHPYLIADLRRMLREFLSLPSEE